MWKIREKIKEWLGLDWTNARVEALEMLLLHTESKMNGYAVLKRHLNRPDKPLPRFGGKEIEQD